MSTEKTAVRRKYKIEGMSCSACSAAVERAVSRLAGVERAEVDLLSGVLVCYGGAEPDAVCRAVESAGFGAALLPEHTQPAEEPEEGRIRGRLIGSVCLLLPLMYLAMAHMGLPLPACASTPAGAVVLSYLQLALLIPILILNRAFFKKGVPALLRGAANMDTLVCLSATASTLYGLWRTGAATLALLSGDGAAAGAYTQVLYYESAAMILTLVTLGKSLEARSKKRTGAAVRALAALRPDRVCLLRDGVEQVVPAEDLQRGDVFIVRPGERICADGEVVFGCSAVDEAALTGESLPVDKAPGDTVLSASLNRNGVLHVRARCVGEDTTLSRMIETVRSAGASKAPVARLADRVSGIFVPTVIVISLLTMVLWLAFGKPFSFALDCAVSVLVISCPCALGLATPVAIVVAVGRCARAGILMRSAEGLQKLASADTVMLDKTGTLTTGELSVTELCPVDESTALLRLAAALEQPSEHPVARAIVRRAEGLSLPVCTDFAAEPGLGVRGRIDGAEAVGGNAACMARHGMDISPLADRADALAAGGQTVVYFAANGRLAGLLALADTPRPGARAAVKSLQDMGLSVVMLTGDNEITARSIAAGLGISEVIAGVLPSEKQAAVAAREAKGHTVVMVGDGINDAPALARASVGLAVRSGTDIAAESADGVLMGEDPAAVADAIHFGRRTMRIIRQNLFWAFFYNVLGIPLAAGALYPAFGLLLDPMFAAAAMSCSSLFVVSNALRLYKMKGRDDL